MKTPAEIQTHAPSYNDGAWRQYTVQELGNWVHLLIKRASHRADPEKRKKDLYDARNYLLMIESHLEDAENK